MATVGFLVWNMSAKGVPTAYKIAEDIHTGKLGVNPVYKKEFEVRTIHKQPLDEVEWRMTIEALEDKYPCPPQPSSNK